MLEWELGSPQVTTRKQLWQILKLAKATKKDVFCDLGCGYGNLCKWSTQKLGYAMGTEIHKDRFRKALGNTREFGNIKILNGNYRHGKTLQKLRRGTIFYCTNNETLGFFRKFEKIVKPKTRLITFYLPPYPVKPTSFDEWYYLMITPFNMAKSPSDWIKSVTHTRSFNGLNKEIKKEFLDYKDKILDLEENFIGMEWIRKVKK